jgi:hypothetical protein
MVLIKLNVGGVCYRTHKETIEVTEFFQNLLENEMAKSITENGEVFIDRNGRIFEHILDFLRGGNLEYLQNDEGLLLQLRSEADFYGMDQMKNEIEKKIKNLDYIKQAPKKKYELIPLESFQAMYGVSPSSGATREIMGMSEGSEFICMINYHERDWVRPRRNYWSERAGDRLYGNQFDEDNVGWQYIKKTSVLITNQG